MATISSEQPKVDDPVKKPIEEKANQEGDKDKNDNSSEDFVIDPENIALGEKQKKEAHEKFVSKDSDLDGYIDVQQLKSLLDGKNFT